MRKNHYLVAVALSTAALAASSMGCELVASVDRARIGEGGSAGAANTGGGGAGNTGGSGSTPETCTNGMKDRDETDVDCGGSCTTKCAGGKTCSEGKDCDSTFCATGVCCDTACDQPCEACLDTAKTSGMDTGTCGPAKADTVCAEQVCTNGVQTNAKTCGDMGTCADQGTTSCGGYACAADGKACLMQCAGDAECATCYTCTTMACQPVAAGAQGNGCTGTQACDGAGACKKANGETCMVAADCGSGHCVDGVCCDTGCAGACFSCKVTDALKGTCSPVDLGTEDPLCTAPATTCNSTGECTLPGGATCNTPDECASNVCTFNLCGNP